jgi:starvation-inducible DNA-binding protein
MSEENIQEVTQLASKADMVAALKELLATSFSFYLKAHNYHWNVTGPNFAQYHEYFGDLYTEVWESVDTTAEEIRKHGSFAPGSLSRFMELTRVEDELIIPDSGVMFSRLIRDNDQILAVLYEARRLADDIGEFGTVNYLEDRISTHEKHAWMLKSF